MSENRRTLKERLREDRRHEKASGQFAASFPDRRAWSDAVAEHVKRYG